MFTGLIQATGRIARLTPSALEIEPQEHFLDSGPLVVGESIAVSGCCLTLVQSGPLLRFDLSPETLQRTSFSSLSIGDAINLERAMALGDRLGGHFVLGHVDEIGEINSIETEGQGYRLCIAAKQPELLVDKGSIAIDGISLTVVSPVGSEFSTAIIPHTWNHTNLWSKRAGSQVNIEYDIIAKHIARLSEPYQN